MVSATLFVLLVSVLAFASTEEECKACCDKPFENAASCCKMPPLIDRAVAKKCGAGPYFDKFLRDVNSKSTGTAAAAKGTAAKSTDKKDATAKKAAAKKPAAKGKRAAEDKSIPCVWDCIFKEMDFYDPDGSIDDDRVEESFKVGLSKAWFEETLNLTIGTCGDIVMTNPDPENAKCDHTGMFFMNCIRRFSFLHCPAESVNKKDPKYKEKMDAVEKCITGIVKDEIPESEKYVMTEEEYKKLEAEYKKKEEERTKAEKAKQGGGTEGKSKKSAAVNAKADPKAAKPAGKAGAPAAAQKAAAPNAAKKTAATGKPNKQKAAAKVAATKKPAAGK